MKILLRTILRSAAVIAIASTTLMARQQITGPTGVVPMGSAAQLTWPPTLWSNNPATVDIRLTHGAGIHMMMIAGAPNNGHASIPLPVPPALPCNPSELYWFTMGPSGATTTKFTMSCPPPPPGSLKVVKTVVNATGGPAPTIPSSFNMILDCRPSGPSRSPITVNVGAAGTTIPALAANSSCRVAETPPAPLLRLEGCRGGGAAWTTTISPGTPVNITANATTTVTVTNTLKCVQS